MEYLPFPIRMTVVKGMPSQFQSKSRFEKVSFPTLISVTEQVGRPNAGQLWPRGK